MATVEPIRKKEDIMRLKEYFFARGEIRNYTMVVIGLNIPLRISDILNLKWGDVYNYQQDRYYQHIRIEEQKTGKQNVFVLNEKVVETLELYRAYLSYPQSNQYIFTASEYKEQPLSRVSAYLIIRHAAEELGLEHIGCHSLRKTFGYHAWKNGAHLAVIMSIYNHSSIQITKRYLGIEQDDKDQVLYTTQF